MAELVNLSLSNYSSSSYSTSVSSSSSTLSSESSIENLYNHATTSSWNSLSGYLQHQTNRGISKLYRRKLWFELDELSCSLVGSKKKPGGPGSISDSPTSPGCTGGGGSARRIKKMVETSSLVIDLQCAGIFPAAKDPCEFIVLSDNVEHIFLAETKQCATMWILALQATRSRFTTSKYSTSVKKFLSSSMDKTHFWSTLLPNKRCSEIMTRQRRSVRSWCGRGFKGFPHLHWSVPVLTKRCQSLDSFFCWEQQDIQDLKVNTEDFLRNDISINCERANKAEEPKRKSSSNASDKIAICKNRNKRDRRSRLSLQPFSKDKRENIVQIIDLENQVLKTKSQIARIFNKEHKMNSMIEAKDAAINDLQQQISILETRQTGLSDYWLVQTKQLRANVSMLGSEIRHLSKQNSRLLKYIEMQNKQASELDQRLEMWKYNYIMLLQSSIPILPEDEDASNLISTLNFQEHKNRICELLAEAKQTNPSLPSYETLREEKFHVDQLCFRNEMVNESEILRYICRQLQQHYRNAQQSQIELLRRWKEILSAPSFVPFASHSDMKALCRKGIPSEIRGEVWRRIVDSRVEKIKEKKGENYFDHLYVQSLNLQHGGFCRKEINLDVLRTMPSNVNFCKLGAPGIKKLHDVLQAFSFHNPDVGYCQGVNFLAALLLLFLDEEDAFWALVCITEVNFSCRYFDETLSGATVDQEVFQELLAKKMPLLFRHLRSFEIEFPTITINWFITVFFDVVPFQTLLRIWDCFLFEGQKVLFRFALAILKMNEEILLRQKDSLSILRILKSSTKLLFDADQMIKITFQDLKPFPKRHEIQTRQHFFLKLAEEKKLKSSLSKSSPSVTRQQRQRMADYESIMCVQNLMHHSSVSMPNNDVLFFLTSRSVSRVRLLQQQTFRSIKLDVKMNFQITSVANWQSYIFISTLSKDIRCYVYQDGCFELTSRYVLRSVGLCICVNGLTYDPSKFESSFNLLVGLKDGNLALVENALHRQLVPISSGDLIYLPISQHSISNVLKVDDYLWIAAGRFIYVFKSMTLNSITKFKVSDNEFDTISLLQRLDDNGARPKGVWVVLEGCPYLQLYHPRHYHCYAVYDLGSKRQLLAIKEEEYNMSARITSLHVRDGETWVGSGDGAIFIIAYLRAPLKRYSKLPGSVENIFKADNDMILRKKVVREACTSKSFSVSLSNHSSINDLSEGLRKSVDGSSTITTTTTTLSTTKITRRSSLYSSSGGCGRASPISELPCFSAATRRQRLVVSMERLTDLDLTSSAPASPTDARLRNSGEAASRRSVDSSFTVQLSLKQKTNASKQPIKCIVSFRYPSGQIGFCTSSGYYSDDQAVQIWRYNNGADLWVSEKVCESLEDDEEYRLLSGAETGSIKETLNKLEHIFFPVKK